MQKYQLKRLLNAIDRSEAYIKTIDDLKCVLSTNTDLKLSDNEINELIDYLIDHHFLVFINQSYDLVANVTLFARSLNGGICEALSLLESISTDVLVQDFFMKNKNEVFSYFELEDALQNHTFIIPTILDSILLTNKKNALTLNEDIKTFIFPIFLEINQEGYLISSINYAFFIKECIHFDNLQMRNIDKTIIKYENFQKIKKILPETGIPDNRNVSENLQSLYKDILLQEFSHECPLCQINLMQMLIASHIKPFRDCGHLIESTDNNNGILLCKNHDFLFDQGFISFKEDGQIIIADEIMEAEYTRYHLLPTYKLPLNLLTKRRIQFLAYHNEFIFKKTR